MDAASNSKPSGRPAKYKADTLTPDWEQHMVRQGTPQTQLQKPKSKWRRSWESEALSSCSIDHHSGVAIGGTSGLLGLPCPEVSTKTPSKKREALGGSNRSGKRASLGPSDTSTTEALRESNRSCKRARKPLIQQSQVATLTSVGPSDTSTTASMHNFQGINFYKRVGRWAAHLWAERKQFYIGSYASATEAASAYDKASLKYFGKHAQLNYNRNSYLEDIQEMGKWTKDKYREILKLDAKRSMPVRVALGVTVCPKGWFEVRFRETDLIKKGKDSIHRENTHHEVKRDGKTIKIKRRKFGSNKKAAHGHQNPRDRDLKDPKLKIWQFLGMFDNLADAKRCYRIKYRSYLNLE